jgi:uncharacterized protein (DUF697 family)
LDAHKLGDTQEKSPITALVPIDSASSADKPMSVTDFQRVLADQTVVNWSQWASVAGFVSIPVVDFLAISGLQLKMIAELCKVYDVPFKSKIARSILSAFATSGLTSYTGSTLSSAFIRYVPYVGTSISMVTQPAIAYATTYALGAVFIKHFESEGTLTSFSVKKLKEFYDAEYKRAKYLFRKKPSATVEKEVAA